MNKSVKIVVKISIVAFMLGMSVLAFLPNSATSKNHIVIEKISN